MATGTGKVASDDRRLPVEALDVRQAPRSVGVAADPGAAARVPRTTPLSCGPAVQHGVEHVLCVQRSSRHCAASDSTRSARRGRARCSSTGSRASTRSRRRDPVHQVEHASHVLVEDARAVSLEQLAPRRARSRARRTARALHVPGAARRGRRPNPRALGAGAPRGALPLRAGLRAARTSTACAAADHGAARLHSRGRPDGPAGNV